MMNNSYNHQNYNCEFAPEIVDFLYGELKDNRQNEFKMHLSKCSDCADEVRDFSEIKFSIQNWKTLEFDKISTPEIIIPYEKAVFNRSETAKALSFWQTFRNYFSVSPVFSGAAAVLLTAFLLAVSLFLFNGKNKDLLAENNTDPNVNPTNFPISAEKIETIDEQKAVEKKIVSTAKTSADKNRKTETPKNSSTEPKNSSTEIVSKSAAVRLDQTNKVSEKKLNSAFNAKSENKSTKTIPVKNKPRLNELPEDDEDKSLRLADLFAELETR